MPSCMNLFKSLEERTLLSLSEDSFWDQPELQALLLLLFFFSILFCFVFIFGFPQFIWLISSVLANKTEIAFWYFLLAFINCSIPKDLKRKMGRVGWKGWESAIWMTFQNVSSSFMKLKGNWKACIQKRVLLVFTRPLSMLPPNPCQFLPYSPTPDFPTPPLPFCCSWRGGHESADLKVWAASESSECNHFRKSRTQSWWQRKSPSLPSSALWPDIYSHSLESSWAGVELNLKKNMGRSGHRPAGTATTQVQLAKQLLQRTPTVYCFKHLVLGRVHVRVQPGIKKRKRKNSQSHSWS